MGEFDDWYIHSVDVDTVGDPDEWGKQPITHHDNVACWIEDKVQLVRGMDGQEVVSSSTLWLPLDKKDWFTPGSVIHFEGGYKSYVIQVNAGDAHGDSLDGISVTLA